MAIQSIYTDGYNCSVAIRLVVFVFLPLKGKQKGIKLSVLCVLAVNGIQTKTFLGVVIDSVHSVKKTVLITLNPDTGYAEI